MPILVSSRRLRALKVITFFLFVTLVLPSVSSAQGGRLDDVRDAVRDDSSSSSSSSSDDDDFDDDDFDDDDDDFVHAGMSRGQSRDALRVVAIFLAPLANIALIPYFLLENRENHQPFSSRGRFLAYPYRGGRHGQMSICWPLEDLENDEELDDACPTDTSENGRPPTGHRRSIRLLGEYAYDLYGVHRPSVYASIDTSFRLGLETGWTHMMERLGDGTIDRLNIGDVNATFRIVQHPSMQVRIGFGWRYMTDEQGLDNGFNYTVGFDVFPIRPLVIAGSIDIGNLGKAFLLHGRLALGLNLGPVEIFVGYDAMLIGPVVLHGPLSGVRIWL